MPRQRTDRAICLIVNRAKANRRDLADAILAAQQNGRNLVVYHAETKEDVENRASKAVTESFDVVAAAGGDGTVNRVLTGMLVASPKNTPALGIVALGTANDFSRACHLPINEPAAALDILFTGRTQSVDAGRINDGYFINASVIGLGADATRRTTGARKRVLGAFAYMVAGVAAAVSGKRYAGAFSLPGERFDADAMFTTVSNGAFAGGVRIAPRARLDDGLLDVVMIPKVPPHRMGRLIQDFLKLRRGLEPDYIRYRQVPWIEVEAADDLPVSPDGRHVTGRRFRFEAMDRRLPVVMPACAS